MAEYHVGCGMFGIYAGTLNKRNKEVWKDKTECTNEAIEAVRDYMAINILKGYGLESKKTGAYEWGLVDGRKVELRITVKENEDGTD